MTKYDELRHFNHGTADEALVNRQLDRHAAGYREVEIVQSLYGLFGDTTLQLFRASAQLWE